MEYFGIDLISWAFAVFNVLRLASYFPQIAAVVRDRHGATAISFGYWSIWVGANASTAIYAWTKFHNASLAWISGLNALCCAIILGVAIYKRALHGTSPSATFSAPSHAARAIEGDALDPVLR